MTNIIRFGDLSYEEKAKLETEQIDEFIKIECAFEGVKLLLEPILPVKPEMGEKTDYFRIGYANELTFEKLEDAERALKVLRTCTMVDTDWSEDYSHVKKIHKFDGRIRTEGYYTLEQYNKMKDALALYNKEKDIYDELHKEWQKEDIKLGRIRDNIWFELDRITKLEHTRGMLMAEFKIYLPMAKGNYEIALNFLTNSWHKEMEEFEKGIGKEKYAEFLAILSKMQLKKS